MLYYLGKGTEFKKEDCKEYKKFDAALRAAEKDENLVVRDETGKVIGPLTDNVPDGALKKNPDGNIPVFNEDGTPAGTVDGVTVAEATGGNEQESTQENTEDDENASNEGEATNPPTEQENDENRSNTEQEEDEEEEHTEDEVIIPKGKMKVTVICDGSLNIRRSPSWGNENICGRAIRGQSYYVKEIHVVNGKKMVRTVGDLYLSGESEYVQFEKL